MCHDLRPFIVEIIFYYFRHILSVFFGENGNITTFVAVNFK